MKNKVYTQMYSLLKTSQEGVLEAMKQIAEIGWDGIEAMGANTGGLSLPEFKAFIKDLGLDIISFHGLRDEGDMAFAQEMGARFTDLRFSEEAVTRDAILRETEKLNEAGKLRAKYGMKAVVHNHASEFFWVKGEENENRIYDLLLNNTDPDLVGFELDLGWAVRAGVDVVDYLKKYAGRFPLLHVKECNEVAKTVEEMEHFPKSVLAMKNDEEQKERKVIKGAPKFSKAQMEAIYQFRHWNVALGGGLIDWPAVVAAAEAQGVCAYVNEREYQHIKDANGDVVKCSKMDYDFLRSL